MKRALARWRGRSLVLAAACGLTGMAVVGAPAMANDVGTEPTVGLVCKVTDGWWSLDTKQPAQDEWVRVMKLQALPSARPGAWVQPLRGPLKDYQFLISARRIRECRD